MYHKFLSFDFFPIISSLQHTLFALYDYLLAGFCVRVRRCLCEIEGTENHIGDEKRKEMKRRKKRDRMATTHMSPSDVSVRSHICLCVSRIALSVNHCRAFVHFYFCCVYTWFGWLRVRAHIHTCSVCVNDTIFISESVTFQLLWFYQYYDLTDQIGMSVIVHRLRYGQNRTSGWVD